MPNTKRVPKGETTNARCKKVQLPSPYKVHGALRDAKMYYEWEWEGNDCRQNSSTVKKKSGNPTSSMRNV